LKTLLFILSFLTLNAFEVEFTKIYTQYVVPKNTAIKIKTKESLTFPFPFIKTDDGYILYGNTQKINMWLDNEFYAPEDAKFQEIKISLINSDKIQYKIIKNIKKVYKSCQIKHLVFLTPDEKIIVTRPENITLKYKVILECK